MAEDLFRVGADGAPGTFGASTAASGACSSGGCGPDDEQRQTRLGREADKVKKTILTLTVLLGIAAVPPLGAQAHPKRDHRLRITLKLPLNFAPTAECPTGAAIYGISVHGQT